MYNPQFLSHLYKNLRRTKKLKIKYIKNLFTSKKNIVLINFLPIVSGGGLQNALTFILNLPNDSRIVALVRQDSLIANALKDKGISKIEASKGILGRLLLEILVSLLSPRGIVCLTLFGPRPLGSRGHLYNIIGFAYSNILYPEFDFWDWCNPIEKLRRRLIDKYRRWSAVTSDEVIFETDVLLKRAKEIKDFSSLQSHVVYMAPSNAISSEQKLDCDMVDRLNKFAAHNPYLILYLSSPHPNKRIHMLADILAADTSQTFAFVTTLDSSHWYTKQVNSRVIKLGVDKRFINIGPVRPTQVGCLIDKVHAMINIARLESFSNNWVEAWRKEKPLITTDSDWARCSCKSGALYVDPNKPDIAAEKIKMLLIDADLNISLKLAGQAILAEYPSAQQKTDHLLDIINKHIAPKIGGA